MADLPAPGSCAALSREAGEELAGTGITATRWLLVESRAPWGHEAIPTAFAEPVAAWLDGLDAKVLAIRRSGRTGPLVAYAAETGETGATLGRVEVDDAEALIGTDPWADAVAVDEPLVLVCAHGRRDACCARLGVPVAAALAAEPGLDVWQCSHTGGHRFAPCVVALPLGVTLGRVAPDEAPALAALLREGRIPLDRYRGRSAYDAPTQAAEVAVRRAHDVDRIDDLVLSERLGDRVVFRTATGVVVETRVETLPGPTLPKSCGAEPEALPRYGVEQACVA